MDAFIGLIACGIGVSLICIVLYIKQLINDRKNNKEIHIVKGRGPCPNCGQMIEHRVSCIYTIRRRLGYYEINSTTTD